MIPTAGAIAWLVESTEAAAYADMFHAAPSSSSFEVHESDDGVRLVAPSIDELLFNRVIGLGLRHPVVEKVLPALLEPYRAAGLRNFGIQLSPEAKTPQLCDALETTGLGIRDYWTKMYRVREPIPFATTDLRIARVSSSHADLFVDVACAGYGMPATLAPVLAGTVGRKNWYHYLVWDGDIAVAAAAMFVRAEVAWLGVAATLAEYRRRGAHGALIARRILDGAHFRCRWFVTETGQDHPDNPNSSFRNVMRAGFTVAYQRPNYMLRKV